MTRQELLTIASAMTALGDMLAKEIETQTHSAVRWDLQRASNGAIQLSEQARWFARDPLYLAGTERVTTGNKRVEALFGVLGIQEG